MNRENGDALAQLAVSLECDLEELRDALVDVGRDLHVLMEFLNRRLQKP